MHRRCSNLMWLRALASRILPLALLVVAACRADSKADDADWYDHILPFDTAQIRIASATDTTRLTVELAESQEQETLGLMERPSLTPEAGMLFLYGTTQPSTSAFWMFRTRIPLDIAFIDSTGVIRSIQTMEPCPSPLAQGCPNYPAGVTYRAALEVNAGFFARTGFRLGDRVLLSDTLARRRATSAGSAADQHRAPPT